MQGPTRSDHRDAAPQRGRERSDASNDNGARKKLRLSQSHQENSVDKALQQQRADGQTTREDKPEGTHRQTSMTLKRERTDGQTSMTLKPVATDRHDPVYGSVCVCHGLCHLTSTKKEAICVCSTGGRVCVIDSENGHVMCELWLPGQVVCMCVFVCVLYRYTYVYIHIYMRACILHA